MDSGQLISKFTDSLFLSSIQKDKTGSIELIGKGKLPRKMDSFSSKRNREIRGEAMCVHGDKLKDRGAEGLPTSLSELRGNNWRNIF